MDENAISLEPLPESGIDPQIQAALEPGEQVYWQARPQKAGIPPIVIFLVLFGLLVAWLEGIRDLAAVQDMLRELINELVAFWQQLPWAFLLFSLLPIGLIYMFWPRQWRYALTDRRVLRLRSGKIAGQASPGKLIFPDIRVLSIRKRSDVGTVRWANSDFYDLDDRKRCLEFKNVRDPDKVTRMLKHWRQQWQDAQTRKKRKRRANRSGRRRSNPAQPNPRGRKLPAAPRPKAPRRTLFNALSIPSMNSRSMFLRPGTFRCSINTTGRCASSALR